MVFEFPELQGTMGGIYAREQGMAEAVWKAIYYHYLPIGVEADAPPSREQLGAAAVSWAAVSLADKIDTVTGLYSAGERPTGSRDPFAIRRNAQGAVRILMDLPELTARDREVAVDDLLRVAGRALSQAGDGDAAQLAHGFWHERLRYALEQRGYSVEVVRAATPVTAPLVPLRARRIADALHATRASADFQALAVLFKRVKNIARERKEDVPLDRTALIEPAEQALLAELDARRPRVDAAARAADYKRAFTEIAGLRPAVDRFFTEVFVMAEDARTRSARLALMAELRDLILQLADISEIVPQTE
jgi:glycyl-tRNA synthetase beta chain